MITIVKSRSNQLKVVLNPNQSSTTEDVEIVFYSPTRSDLRFTKPLSLISSGLFLISITTSESDFFQDDSYTYTIKQEEKILKFGHVRVCEADEEEDTLFDYTLDFTMS